MSSTKLILILIIATNMCCALERSEQMKAFCAENRIDYMNRDSKSKLHFYRRNDNKCNHWVLKYDNWTNTYDLLSHDSDSKCDYPTIVCIDTSGNWCISGKLMSWTFGGIQLKDPGTFDKIDKFVGVFWLKDNGDIYMIGENWYDKSPRNQNIYRFKVNQNEATLEPKGQNVYDFFSSNCKYGTGVKPTNSYEWLIWLLVIALIVVLVIILVSILSYCLCCNLRDNREPVGFRQPVYGRNA